ncbi:MAG: hypothetical protein FJW32_03210 [Acidobacteria bacterium]|nr:hypothetical protein [Acidobacteriota bacterium]
MALAIMWIWVAAAFAQTPAKNQNCAPCHNDQIADFATHKHSKQFECGICHGPSEKHRASTGTVPPDRIAGPDKVAALCGNCHAQEQQHFERSKHNKAYSKENVRTANCVNCHGQHANRPMAAVERNCVRCHQTTPDKCKGQPVAPLARVSCMGCHARHTLVVHGQ